MTFFDDGWGRGAWGHGMPLWSSMTATGCSETVRSEAQRPAGKTTSARRSVGDAAPDHDKAMAALEAANKRLSSALERERSEFASYRRRMDGDHAKAVTEGKAQFLRTLLPVLDDLERIYANEPLSTTMRATVSKLQAVLDGLGAVETVVETGEPFDPQVMHAIAVEPSMDVAHDHVIEMIAPGWAVDGVVIRPVQVIVAHSMTSHSRRGGYEQW